MVSFALSELDMQQILKTLTTLSYVRRKATNILLLYNTHNLKVAGSNPAPATKNTHNFSKLATSVLRWLFAF